MRKITQEACLAFKHGNQYKKANMQVDCEAPAFMPAGSVYKVMKLHGNTIACQYDTDKLIVTLAGWNTVTTRERVNGLLCYMCNTTIHISQRKGRAYLCTMDNTRGVEIASDTKVTITLSTGEVHIS